MGIANACDARDAINASEQQLETAILEAAILGFVALATSEGWSRELIDADLERWGYGIDGEERTGASLACH
jgi:hypothetical protein